MFKFVGQILKLCDYDPSGVQAQAESTQKNVVGDRKNSQIINFGLRMKVLFYFMIIYRYGI